MQTQQPTSFMRRNRLKRAATFDFAKQPDKGQSAGEPQQKTVTELQQREEPQAATNTSQQRKLQAKDSSSSLASARPSKASFAPLYADVDDDDDSSSTSDFADIMIGRHHRHTTTLLEDTAGNELWTTAAWFKNLVAGIIVANTVVLITQACVIQMQFSIFGYLDWVFTALYVCELVCCVAEQGIKKYLCEDDWWNWFDLFVTISCVVDLIVVTTASGASITRLFRLFRIMRMFRGLRFLSELDYVLIQIVRATLKLGFLASLMLFVSSMVGTSLLWDCNDPEVAGMFENLGRSLWTMFKIMTLDNWIATVDVVIEVKPEMIWFFILFIFSTAISLISLAPAMFIDISLKQMEHEDFKQKELARSQLRTQKKTILSMLFKLTDMEDNGSISVDELKTVLTNDSFLRELENRGISQADELRDVRLGLFDLWEEHLNTTEGNRPKITIDEFTDGLSRHHEEFSQAVLWRGITSTRLLLSDLAAVVLDELAEFRYEMSSNFEQATAGLLRSSAEDSPLSMTPPISPQSADSVPHRKLGLARNPRPLFRRRSTVERLVGSRLGAKGHAHNIGASSKKEGNESNVPSGDEMQMPVAHKDALTTNRLTARLDCLISSQELQLMPLVPSEDGSFSGGEQELDPEHPEHSMLVRNLRPRFPENRVSI